MTAVPHTPGRLPRRVPVRRALCLVPLVLVAVTAAGRRPVLAEGFGHLRTASWPRLLAAAAADHLLPSGLGAGAVDLRVMIVCGVPLARSRAALAPYPPAERAGRLGLPAALLLAFPDALRPGTQLPAGTALPLPTTSAPPRTSPPRWSWCGPSPAWTPTGSPCGSSPVAACSSRTG